MITVLRSMLWLGVGLLGGWAYVVLAAHRGETTSSAYILIAALCTYAIGYRFYSKWLATRVLVLDDRRATPCEVHDDGKDFVRTNRWIVFGHHFAAISGPGPLVGPVLAAQFGYLPGALWILIGVVLGGAVQDLVVLFCSMRRDGRSLGQMVKEELSPTAGYVASVAILAIMTILLAVLALVVVRALAESPWGVFTVGATVPIAMFMGGYLRFWRVGKVLEASVWGVALLLLAVWGGRFVHGDPHWARLFTVGAEPLAWAVIAYGLAASVLPVWLLLAPRDYLSTFMKLGTIFALAVGVFMVLPDLRMPALSRFVDGSGPVVAGKLFPFCFITIACGAISGFHTLIASGTTPKLLTREGHARAVGYGAMCLESLVATMALIAACTLEPGVYLSMNIKGAGADAAAVAADTVAKVTAAGFPITTDTMGHLAAQIGEKTLFGRTGGAATLAVGMAQIFARAVSDRWLDLWYHFAIMFEALFILTTLDAGTRVGRYLLQDLLGNLWRPLGRTDRLDANLLASGLMVAAWGFFLIQGVRDPLGGVNSLWPLFGIANQMLAAIALCLGTTVLLKMMIGRAAAQGVPADQALGSSVAQGTSGSSAPSAPHAPPPPRAPARLWLVAVTWVPLVWLVSVTFTAGYQKIFHVDPRIGFLAQARALETQWPRLRDSLAAAESAADPAALAAARQAARVNRTLRFNNRLDAGVAVLFLGLVSVVLGLSVREWYLLLARRRPAELRETPPVWLPAYAVAEGRVRSWWAWWALGVALLRELSGEAALDRARAQAAACACASPEMAPAPRSGEAAAIYVSSLEDRYRSVRRCC